jgi:integrase
MKGNLKLPHNVREREDGFFEIRITNKCSKRKSKYVRPEVGLTKRQTEDWLAEERARFCAEVNSDYTTPLLFGEVLDMYLGSSAVKIRDTTRSVYEGQAPRIKDALAHIRIDRLTSIAIQEFIDTLSAGLKENNKGIIVNVFNHAMELQMVNRNPAKFAVVPKRVRKAKIFHTREEVGQILTALVEYSNKNIGAYAVAQLRLFVEFAIHSGMRTGELLGLSWSDIDVDSKKVHIHQQLIYDKRKLYISPETKNGKDRVIEIPDRIINLLIDYKSYQMQEQERMGWSNNGMLFSDRRTGDLLPTSAPADWFEGFCKQFKFRYLSPHSFRHFFATVLYSETKDVALVAEVIGDKISTVIEYYVHSEDGSIGTACNAVASAIESAIKKA